MITKLDTEREIEYFNAKLEFTTGPMELHFMIERGDSIGIVDVRHYEDYARSHIPSAVSLPEEQWDHFDGLSTEKPNIVYCYSQQCHLAARACKYFAEHGYPVMELEGGFDVWEHYSMPVEK